MILRSECRREIPLPTSNVSDASAPSILRAVLPEANMGSIPPGNYRAPGHRQSRALPRRPTVSAALLQRVEVPVHRSDMDDAAVHDR